MKKVLILSYLFAPQNRVGAIRPTKVAKFLKIEGFNVDVITSGDYNGVPSSNKDTEYPDTIHYVKHSKMYKWFLKKVIKENTTVTVNSNNIIYKKKSFLKKLISSYLREILQLMNSIDYYYSFKNYINNNKMELNCYDVVISTYGPTSSNLCGLWVKKHFKDIYWIADFRDPMTFENTPKLIAPILKSIQNRTIKIADFIIAVSEGYQKRICSNVIRDNTRVLTNGFDNDDLAKVIKKDINGKFSFAYVGALYEGKRDASIIFQIIQELAEEQLVNLDDFEFHYAGSDYRYLYKQAEKYKLEERLKNYGYVSREESLNILNECRYLVLLTWNSNGEEGVIPGKTFEYIMMQKPIAAIIHGNAAQSEIYKLIRKTNSGIAYESSQHKIHYEKLKGFIRDEYAGFKKSMPSQFSPKMDIINEYNYKYITKRIIEIIEKQ